MAAPRATMPAMSGVPASNLKGISFRSCRSKLTALDHVAAALVGRHRLQMLGLAVEHAHAGRPVELVAGEDEEVGSPAPARRPAMCCTAWAASISTGTPRAWAMRTISCDRVDRAQHVGDPGHGDHPRARRDPLARTPSRISSPVSVIGAATTLAPVARAASLPGHDVGVVLHLGDQDLVAGCSSGAGSWRRPD